MQDAPTRVTFRISATSPLLLPEAGPSVVIYPRTIVVHNPFSALASKKIRGCVLIRLLGVVVCLGPTSPDAQAVSAPVAVSAELQQRAVAELRETLHGQPDWTKVHAAEFLLALGCTEEVSAVFRRELTISGSTPKYRVGIWRVLARAAVSQQERETWINKIHAIVLDPEANDRPHAIESLAKLGYRVRDAEEAIYFQELGRSDEEFTVYVQWVLANTDQQEGIIALAKFLEADDLGQRLTAAYALRFLRPEELPVQVQDELVSAALAEPEGSAARVYMLTTALAGAVGQKRTLIRSELLSYLHYGTSAEKYEVISAGASIGEFADLPLLNNLLEESDADPRTAAAYAICRLYRRASHSMTPLDWTVIALYAAGMLSVGWYYSRRSVNTEDYLLGGRKMTPWAVGLSMFATLLSTISYLAFPGEIIKHGPMIIGEILGLPLVFLIVGWLIIPQIMKLKITSAYEFLELRLGPRVRLLGSLLFLSLRISWMAMIIYATTNKVLLPLLGWDPSAEPYVCAFLGMITIVYTSMGGMRAVVVSDVIQTLLLFSGAILTIVIINSALGGVDNWWPQKWPSNWDEPILWFDVDARITLVSVLLSSLTWYICTTGSDQLAIQRYLATGDVSAARRMLAISLGSGVLVLVLLMLLGFALLSFFQANPHLLGDGQSVASNADQLFPRFILIGLPPGVTGLVVAALLAAAMSSLSSGISSSCAVITVDFIDRYRTSNESEADHLSQAKYVSWLVGFVVVSLSSLIGSVEGNLLEVCFKVANLFTAPLFVLFFTAMFIPWATSFGAISASITSLVVALAIAFRGLWELSFIWIVPLSLLSGIVVGLITSLAPIGRHRTNPT